MNKIMLSRALVAALVLWLWVAHAPPPARAHAGPPRVELAADQLSPGATLEIQGINIAPEQQVTLALVQPNLEIPLGLAMGDQHGDFKAVFALPRTLEPGAYMVRAVGANRVIVGATLTIISAGAADDAEEDASQPNALPQDGPASQPQPASLSSTAGEPPAIESSTDLAIEPSIGLAIALVVALVALIGVMIAIRRWAIYAR